MPDCGLLRQPLGLRQPLDVRRRRLQGGSCPGSETTPPEFGLIFEKFPRGGSNSRRQTHCDAVVTIIHPVTTRGDRGVLHKLSKTMPRPEGIYNKEGVRVYGSTHNQEKGQVPDKENNERGQNKSQGRKSI